MTDEDEVKYTSIDLTPVLEVMTQLFWDIVRDEDTRVLVADADPDDRRVCASYTRAMLDVISPMMLELFVTALKDTGVKITGLIGQTDNPQAN